MTRNQLYALPFSYTARKISLVKSIPLKLTVKNVKQWMYSFVVEERLESAIPVIGYNHK